MGAERQEVMAETKFRHTVSAGKNAGMISDWLKNRGGILVWQSVDLSDPEHVVTTPALDQLGNRPKKPDWKCDDNPTLLTNPDEIGVASSVEVKRFHVATRMGSQGFCIKVTDGGSNRIRREVAKAEARYGYGKVWYCFDYSDYDNAVIMADTDVVSVTEWRKRNEVQNAKAAGQS